MLGDLALFVPRVLLAEAFVGATAFASYAIAAAALRSAPRLLRFVGAVVAGTWLATAGWHALTILHVFTWPAATAAIASLAAAAVVLERRTGAARACARSDGRFLARAGRRMRASPWRFATLAFAAAFAPLLLRPLVAPIAAWDSLTYHGIKAVLAVQTGRAPFLEAPGMWAYAGPSWGGHEALAAWAMLPLHTDALSTFAESVQFVALGLALIALAREAGVREPFASLAAGAALSVPTLRLLVGSAYVETGAMMALASALALLAFALRRRRAAPLLFAAAALGVATGMKINLPSVTAPLGLLLIVAAARLDASRRERAAVALASLGLVAVCVLPWMVRSALVTGAPFSPLPLRLGPLRLGASLPEMVAYMARPGLAPGDPRMEWAALRGVFALASPAHEVLGAATAVLLALGALGALRASRIRPWAAVVTTLAAAVTFAAYFSPDFVVVRQGWNATSARFLLPAVVAWVPLAGAGLRARSLAGRAVLAACGAIAFVRLVADGGVGLSSASWVATAIAALGLVALGLAARLARRRLAPRAFALVAALAVASFVAALQPLRERIRMDVWRHEFQLHDFDRTWVEAVPLVDEPSRPRRIAVTSGPWQNLDNWFVFPFAGRALQNEILYVTPARDGEVLHFGPSATNRRFVEAADPHAWLARLRAEGVTDVLSFSPRSLEQIWMEARPDLFSKRTGDEQWGLFELAPGGDSP